MGGMIGAYRILVGTPRRRWEDNIKWILEKKNGNYELDSSGSGQTTVAGPNEHGNEPSGSIKS
jgi:hypothetical protein